MHWQSSFLENKSYYDLFRFILNNRGITKTQTIIYTQSIYINVIDKNAKKYFACVLEAPNRQQWLILPSYNWLKREIACFDCYYGISSFLVPSSNNKRLIQQKKVSHLILRQIIFFFYFTFIFNYLSVIFIKIKMLKKSYFILINFSFKFSKKSFNKNKKFF